MMETFKALLFLLAVVIVMAMIYTAVRGINSHVQVYGLKRSVAHYWCGKDDCK